MLTNEQEQDEARRAARLARLEERMAERERPRYAGPHKALVTLGEHKAVGLDEDGRLRHAQKFAGSPAERAAREAEAEHQLVAETHAREMERKG